MMSVLSQVEVRDYTFDFGNRYGNSSYWEGIRKRKDPMKKIGIKHFETDSFKRVASNF